MRRERARASPPRTMLINPTTMATMAPASPLPVPIPPAAFAACSPPTTTLINPATAAAIAPRRPLPVPIRPGGAGQSQPTEDHADQPHHRGNGGHESPGAEADTTGGTRRSRREEAHAGHDQYSDGPQAPTGMQTPRLLRPVRS